MALEKSILNYDIVCNLLKQYYDIDVSDIERLKLGTANCYRICDKRKCYFLKEFQSSFSEKTVLQEAKILEYLSNTDIPVTRFYKTINGDFFFNYCGHIICLEEFIEGQTYGYDKLPLNLLPQVGQMLGKIHFALKDYDLPVDMADEWLSSFSAEKIIFQYDSLISVAHQKDNDKNIERIIEDLQYKKQLAVRCEKYKDYYKGTTYSATHGDYQGCQLIFEGNSIKSVIDFSSACCLPITWEIMRSFVQSSKQCRNTATIDISSFCEYVKQYMKFYYLTERDMLSMPYVYLFQLARSKYGYPQYLNSDSEDREGLLNFAFWRTQMCREVESKAEILSQSLLDLLS